MEININIKGEQLKKLFNFLNQLADMVSIERYCTEKIPNDEFIALQTEYEEYILENDNRRRSDYESNRKNYRETLRKHLEINNDKEATQYFDTLLNQDMENLKSLKNNGKIRNIIPIEEDAIRKQYTRVTITTEGPIRQQYYLKIGKLLKRIELDMDSLFSFPYIINNEEYENLTFYRENNPIFAICSHENFACIMLDDDKIKELKKLGIPLED